MTPAEPTDSTARPASAPSDPRPDLDADAGTNAAWHARFTRAEIQELLRVSSVRGWLSIVINWGLIAAAFALVATWPNPLTMLLALFVIGARQLGCAVLMHEASHRTLLADKRWNDWVGRWLCAYPVWADLYAYRPYHLQHHAKTWTAADPDLGLVLPFPITRASLKRKVGRDLSGRTGMKFARAAWRRSISRWRAGDADGRCAFVGVLVTNAALLAVLTASGHPWLYLLWVGAWLTTYTLATRIRAIAEHAMVPDPADPLRHTRTTLASWWERLLLAPNRVNYHLEHHLLMTVPHYRLPAMHEQLVARGLLDEALVTRGYRAVLARAASRDAVASGASGAGAGAGTTATTVPRPPPA
ncbi:fatty acid desaturase family protein [Myxococcota bacterium]|nr:fatty acid desaturase family protein [Myxococcota bacterium]MCZ7616934.1 fatty acid desaturase family protein [Myxococcota bacterium]